MDFVAGEGLVALGLAVFAIGALLAQFVHVEVVVPVVLVQVFVTGRLILIGVAAFCSLVLVLLPLLVRALLDDRFALLLLGCGIGASHSGRRGRLRQGGRVGWRTRHVRRQCRRERTGLRYRRNLLEMKAIF